MQFMNDYEKRFLTDIGYIVSIHRNLDGKCEAGQYEQ